MKIELMPVLFLKNEKSKRSFEYLYPHRSLFTDVLHLLGVTEQYASVKGATFHFYMLLLFFTDVLN